MHPDRITQAIDNAEVEKRRGPRACGIPAVSQRSKEEERPRAIREERL